MAPIHYQMLAASVGISILLQRYAPQYSIGAIATSLVLFFTAFTAHQAWSIIIYPRFFSPIRNLPTPPGNHFFLGQTQRVFRAPSGEPARDWVETVPNEGLIRYSMWFQERLLITNPKALGEVLVTKNYDFIKPKQLRESLGRILGVGILLAEGDEHKIQRKNLMPAFAFRHVKDLYPVFWSKSREMVEAVAKAAKSPSAPVEKSDQVPGEEKQFHASGAIDVGDFVSRATLDIIGLSGMGRDFGSLHDQDNKLNKTYRTIFNPTNVGKFLQIAGIFLPLWFLRALPVQRNDDITGASQYIKEVCRDLISKKRTAMAEKERTDVDIVSVALESGGFTDEELVNQMMTFLVAGHETTATAMNWALYLLCKHPDIQKKLRDEVRSKLPSLDEDITPAQLDSCHYLHAVCTEILRLWPPVSLTLRVAACDTSIVGHFVPKDTTIILAPWAINRSTHLWGADAMEFKPERWLDADGKANNKGGAESSFSYLTFLHGPRSCIGQKFAQAEFECLLAAWAGRFETVFEEGSPLFEEEPKIKGGITMKPKGGIWVQCKELEGW
ncbi:hypothetical protein LTR37_013170 [Vermiconidia calcicola]|uniref:Uncharacterized protein n=1 Tax=Vermiconidia calcicola TaxID=1690605 RepID=A0ACC3MXJ1_9PEZI|nr:hypothetical protein LTR37_013170 [Vermiconidia calcicola]